jgi:hypothetical protein
MFHFLLINGKTASCGTVPGGFEPPPLGFIETSICTIYTRALGAFRLRLIREKSHFWKHLAGQE